MSAPSHKHKCLVRLLQRKGLFFMPKIKCFEENYMEYDTWFDENEYVYLSELKAISEFIPEAGIGMEVGIGSGKFAAPLGITIGVEPSQKMRELAEKRNLVVLDGVGEALPFGDERFDYILMVTTLCFLDDAKKAFQEAKRVLKQNGVIIVGFVDKDSPLGKIYEKKKPFSVFYRDAVFYATTDVLSLLEEAGFTNAEMIQTVFGKLSEIKEVQDFKQGYDEGGFVVIRAYK